MPVRLNVLLVQSSGMSGLQSEFNAELAVQMMGVPGLDLSIVNSLDRDEAAETDRLLLTSLQNDLAVLDWRDPSETVLALGRLGITGSRAPHRLDPGPRAAPGGQRRLYLVDLRRGDPPTAVVAALRALLDDRRVVAVTLTIPAASQTNTDSSSTAPQATHPPVNGVRQPATEPDQPIRSEASESAAGRAPEDASRRTPQPPQEPVSGMTKRPGESELDALVEGVNDAQW